MKLEKEPTKRRRWTKVGDTLVDSEELANQLATYLQENKHLYVAQAALDFGVDRYRIYYLIERYVPNGVALLEEFKARKKFAREPEPFDFLSTITQKELLKPQFPYILRYRSQPQGRIMIEGALTEHQIVKKRLEIAQERGWNFHFVTLYPVSTEAD